MEGGAFNGPNAPKRPAAASIRRRFAPEFVKVQNRIPVEVDLIRRAHKKRNGVLVIENHLGSSLFPPWRLFAEFNETAGNLATSRYFLRSAEFQDRSMSSG